ncbi:MAG: TolC family protein [Bacteroidota bacterium]
MKNLLLSLIYLLIVGSLSAQSPVLEAYIQTGLSNNLALQQKNLDVKKSVEAVRQAKTLFSPTVTFGATYTMAAGGRKIDLPIGDLLNPVYGTLNQLTMSKAFPQIQNQSINFLPNNFQETKVKVAYPIFNSDLRYNKEIQTQLVQSKTAEKAAYEHELRYQITEAYLQYLQSLEAEKIWTNTQTVLTELKRFNESLVKNNVATREIVATADYELSKAENEIFQLRSKQHTVQAYFNFLINKPLQSDVTMDTSLLRVVVPAYSTEELITNATTKRKEFGALQAGMDAAATAVKLNDANRKLPDAYIGAETGFQGYGYNWFNGKQAYVLAQVGLTYDLYNGGQTKSKVQLAKIEAEKLHNQYDQVQQQIALQIIKAADDLEAARNGWRTSKNGLNAAEAGFKIVSNKYKAQQALLIEYLDAQNRVTTARLQVLLAWTDVLVKEAALRQAAGL